ncbi:hypothetical protein QTO01_20080 [Vibrio mytili]|uniref:hypothetical protein n=1 Tax=Vibrio mytili TaxID=50718 RepID=UPI002F3EF3B6
MDYSKDLCNPPLGLDRESPIHVKAFFNPIDGFVYEYREFSIKGSSNSGCIEVVCFEYSPEDDYTLEYADEVFQKHGCKYRAAEESLALGIPPVKETVTARYVYSDAKVCFQNPDEILFGKQIRGAYVDAEFARAKLTKEVYLNLLDRYGTLVSDNVQSVDGHGLWAFGVCNWGEVSVYDSKTQRILSRMLPNGVTPDHGIVPWSTMSDLKANDLSKLREGFWTSGVCLRHLILVLRKT